jgi:hypothetical protein
MGCCGGRRARDKGRSLRNSGAGAGGSSEARTSAGAPSRRPRAGLEFLRRPPGGVRVHAPVAAPGSGGSGAGAGQRGKS